MKLHSSVVAALVLSLCTGCGVDEDGEPEPWEFSEVTPSDSMRDERPDRPDRPNPNPDPNPDPAPDPTPTPTPEPTPDPDPTTPGDTDPLPRPCSGGDAPSRCDTQPDAVDWASASVLHRLWVEGTDSEPVCCFDFNGDGEVDNSWGMNLAAFGFLSSTNEQVQSMVQRGEPAIVLELDGLAADRQGPMRLNWWLGGFADDRLDPNGTDVLVASDLIDSGSQPRTTFANARVEGTRLLASGGTVLVPFVFFFTSGLEFAPTPIRSVRLEAQVLSGPFPTLSGRLGGVIRVSDTFSVVNRYVEQNCDCLGLSEPLLEKSSGFCDHQANGQACLDAGQDTCAELADTCDLFGAIGIFADHDSDADGIADSVSIGMRFDGWPATILGTQ